MDWEYRYKIEKDIRKQYWRNLWDVIKKLLRLN